ncbi:2485_t:CDS:2 [Funneliformis mosseae]|uniref:2485_t:CDS:1 n=1 Tax=Funneliformis mosseae TaxID=27381 RepID=A0A9N8Z0A9_FUNMO|nr:2485_t:CDS:2 [Funneliformis mosseae]
MKLLLEELFNHVRDYLVEKKSTWVKQEVRQNFVLILNAVFRLPGCKRLQDCCLELICANPQLIITSKSFTSLDVNYSRLSRDLSLRLNDGDDFNVIIQISEDKNAKSFRAHSIILRARSSYFKRVLSVTKKNDLITQYKPNFTPVVFNMILTYIYSGELYLIKTSADDTFGLLIAADDLLLEELFIHVQDHLIEEHTDWIEQNFSIISPPRLRRIQSKIVNPELTYIIARWIERRNESYPLLRKKYKFELLYRGTRDELNADSFRKKYSNHGPCLVLFKQHMSPVIYGEYNPLKFVPRSRWYSEQNSFIFSFENDQDTTNMRISRLLEFDNRLKRCVSYARNEWINNKFYFASTFRKMDHFVYPNFSGYYDHKVQSDVKFIPEEIEVFNVNIL